MLGTVNLGATTPNARDGSPLSSGSTRGGAGVGSGMQSLRRHQARRGFATRPLRVCGALPGLSSCGLGSLSPRLTPAEYADFYATAYRPLVSAYHGRLIDAETVQEEQRLYAAELVGSCGSRCLRARAGARRRRLDRGRRRRRPGRIRAAATVLDPAPDELAHAAAAGMETIAGFAEDADVGDQDLRPRPPLPDDRSPARHRGHAPFDPQLGRPGGCAFVDVLDVEFMMLRRGAIEGAVKIDHPYSLTRDDRARLLRAGGAATDSRAPLGRRSSRVPARAGRARGARLGRARQAAAEKFSGAVWRLRASA